MKPVSCRIHTGALLASVGLLGLISCGKSSPSPWKELGVPSEKLSEVHAGTNENEFSGTYKEDPHVVVEAFRAGLAKNGVNLCGKVVRSKRSGTEAYFRQDDAFLHLRIIPLEEKRSSALLSKTKFEHGWGPSLDESGCEVPGLKRRP